MLPHHAHAGDTADMAIDGPDCESDPDESHARTGSGMRRGSIGLLVRTVECGRLRAAGGRASIETPSLRRPRDAHRPGERPADLGRRARPELRGGRPAAPRADRSWPGIRSCSPSAFFGRASHRATSRGPTRSSSRSPGPLTSGRSIPPPGRPSSKSPGSRSGSTNRQSLTVGVA